MPMKDIEQYIHLALLIVLYKVGLTLNIVDETLVCDYSSESCLAVRFCGTVHYFVLCLWMKPHPSAWPFKWRMLAVDFSVFFELNLRLNCKDEMFVMSRAWDKEENHSPQRDANASPELWKNSRRNPWSAKPITLCSKFTIFVYSAHTILSSMLILAVCRMHFTYQQHTASLSVAQ